MSRQHEPYGVSPFDPPQVAKRLGDAAHRPLSFWQRIGFRKVCSGFFHSLSNEFVAAVHADGGLRQRGEGAIRLRYTSTVSRRGLRSG